MDFSIHEHIELASTQTTLKKLVDEGAAVGTVVTAEKQTAGRGRGSHVWASPQGGLYLSIFLPSLQNDRPPTDLSFLVGVSLWNSLHRLGADPALMKLKWPNDLLYRNRKVAGILCDSHPKGTLIGVGLNLNASSCELAVLTGANVAFVPSSLKEELGHPLDRMVCLNAFLAELRIHWQIYVEEGPELIFETWLKQAAFLHQTIQVLDPVNGMAVGGSFEGIDGTGGLLLKTNEGLRTFHFGEMRCYSLSM